MKSAKDSEPPNLMEVEFWSRIDGSTGSCPGTSGKKQTIMPRLALQNSSPFTFHGLKVSKAFPIRPLLDL